MSYDSLILDCVLTKIGAALNAALLLGKEEPPS